MDTLTQSDLESVVVHHEQWLDSADHLGGTRAVLDKHSLTGLRLASVRLSRASFKAADLSAADLSDADLRGVDFGDAVLEGANFSGAILRGATFSRAHARGAIFTNADLLRAHLDAADLQDCSFDGARGFTASQCAGSNLSGATLPPYARDFRDLDRLDESAKSAKRLSTMLLLGSAYCVFAISSTSDQLLVSNSPVAPLPWIGGVGPLAWAYIAAPIILFGMFVTLNFYLLKLSVGFRRMPAYFPDGRSIYSASYPWLLNTLAWTRLLNRPDDHVPLDRFYRVVAISWAWLVVPTTLVLVWLRYLTRHDWTVTSMHMVLLVSSFVLSQFLVRLARRDFGRSGTLSPARSWSLWLSSSAVAALVVIVSFSAIEGQPPLRSTTSTSLTELSFSMYTKGPDANAFGAALPIRVIHGALARISFHPAADLVDAQLSSKPGHVSQVTIDQAMMVKGADLRRADLRYANATNAFLVNARLERSNLSGMTLTDANMTGGNFSNSRAVGVIFMRAIATGAEFQHVDLRASIFHNARLERTIFFNVNAERASFYRANLDGANLALSNYTRANFQGASLRNAKFHWANLNGALFTPGSDIVPEERVVPTVLSGAMFFGATVDGADFRGADLSETRGLTKEQLAKAITDESTKLPPTGPAENQPAQRPGVRLGSPEGSPRPR